MLRKLVSHSLLYAIGPQLPKVASIFVLPLVTPFLTPEDYGISATVTAWMGLLGGLRILGFDAVLVRDFYARTAFWPLLWRQILGWLTVWSLPFGLLQAGTIVLCLPDHAAENVWLMVALMCLPSAIFEPTLAVGGRLLQVTERPLYIAVVSAFSGSVVVAINYFAIAHLRLGYLGWFIAQAAGTCVQGALYAKVLYADSHLFPLFRFRWASMKPQLRVSLPVVPHNYSSYMLNASDRLVMDVLHVKLGEMGRYGVAYTLGSYLDIIGTAVGMAASPFTTKLWALRTPDAKQQCRTLIFALQVLFIAGASLVALWAREIMAYLIRNDELNAAYPLAALIVMSYAYRPMYWCVVNKLMFQSKTNELWKLSFVAGVGNIVMNFALIPSMGVTAAAATTFLSLLYLGFGGFALPAYKQLDDLPHYPWRWLTGIVAMTSLTLWLQDASIGLKGSVTAAGFVIVLGLGFANRAKLAAVRL